MSKIVEDAKKAAIEEKGRKAEEQASLELSVAFAKATLIPKMARFTSEKVEELHPLLCSLHKPLGYDLATVCGPRYTREVNLGGLLVKPLPADRSVMFSLFGSYDPNASMLKTLIALTPKQAQAIGMDLDIFTAVGMLTGKAAPEFRLTKSASKPADFYVEPGPDGKQIHVCCIDVAWPFIGEAAYFEFLNNLWDYAVDVLFTVAGPEIKGVL